MATNLDRRASISRFKVRVLAHVRLLVLLLDKVIGLAPVHVRAIHADAHLRIKRQGQEGDKQQRSGEAVASAQLSSTESCLSFSCSAGPPKMRRRSCPFARTVVASRGIKVGCGLQTLTSVAVAVLPAFLPLVLPPMTFLWIPRMPVGVLSPGARHKAEKESMPGTIAQMTRTRSNICSLIPASGIPAHLILLITTFDQARSSINSRFLVSLVSWRLVVGLSFISKTLLDVSMNL